MNDHFVKSSPLIAIIDDGVYEGYFEVPKIAQRLVLYNGKWVADNSSPSLVSHGSICAHVIYSMFPDARIVSLKILERNQATTVENLNKGLEWCLQHNVKIINLSLGSTEVKDKIVLEPVINRLVESGTIISAAYSNSNISTWPAEFPGVLGVKFDRLKNLRPNSFAFSESLFKCGRYVIVARYEREILSRTGNWNDCWSNSIVAPMITGIVAEYLSINPSAQLNSIVSYLKTIADTNQELS